jgi:peptide/nickel transport system substrate-binding protein
MQSLKEKGFMTEAIYAHDGLMELIILNLKNENLQNKKVRHALAHAINREEIRKKAYFDLGKIPVGPIPSTIPWAFSGDVPQFDYNVEKANRLLDEAGCKRDSSGTRFQIEFVYAADRTNWDRTANIVKAQLREVGIDVKLRPLEYGACLDEVYKKHNFGFTYWSLTMGPDPAVGTARLYLTSQIKPLAFTNAMSYSNPQVDQLFEEAAGATTREEASQKYKMIQKLIVEDMPCIWTIEAPYPMAWSSKLVGLPEGPYWTHRLENVGFKK